MNQEGPESDLPHTSARSVSRTYLVYLRRLLLAPVYCNVKRFHELQCIVGIMCDLDRLTYTFHMQPCIGEKCCGYRNGLLRLYVAVAEGIFQQEAVGACA